MEGSTQGAACLCARVWLVLAYSAVFEFPLTKSEVGRRFWQFAGETLPSQGQIETSLFRLLSIGVVNKSGKWWYLSSQPQAPNNRSKWEINSKQKVEEAAPAISFLAKLPWVVGVAITGSVAVDSAKVDDDVDFLIVTEPNRLWLTRVLTLLFAIKYGKRRSFAREESNSWCFNLWLTTRALAVPTDRHTLYTAYEVCQANWVVNKHQIAQQFLINNMWVEPILPRYYQNRQTINGNLKQNAELKKPLFLLEWFLTALNSLFFLLQYIYMMPHRTIERVHWDYAWFHPRKHTDN